MVLKLEAGYGETIITPDLGIELAGFGFYLGRRAQTVLDELKVRALYISDLTQSLFLISCDLLGLSVSFSDRLRRRIGRRHKMPIQNVLLASTHTHSGPATQALPGLGKVNPGFMGKLLGAIEEATWQARTSAEKALFGFHSEAVEPIGYNRRQQDFAEIDPRLMTAVFKQEKKKIYLLNYACHAVTLGPTRAISADWPGAAIAEIEKDGDHGLVLQGFCGDIDPVTYLNRRLGATQDDLTLMGKIIASRAKKSERFVHYQTQPRLAALECRIQMPLQVFPKRQLPEEALAAQAMTQEFPGAGRVVRAWVRRVEKHHAAFRRSPWMENVPIQAMAIGDLKILGLPGEVFCELGLKLRRRWSALMTVGYANGNIGYLPSRKAFRHPDDYACSVAPKFYGLFPFAPTVESTLIRTGQKLLLSLEQLSS